MLNAGVGAGGNVFALEKEMHRIQDLRDDEIDMRDTITATSDETLEKQSYGNAFMSSAFAGMIIAAMVTIVGIVFIAQFVIPHVNGDVALADRKFLNQSCTMCQTQTGAQGRKGEPGISGATGGTGGTGGTGAKGDPGGDGKKGEPAMCEPNPMFPCAKGETGGTGAKGQKGDTGAGIQGQKGETGGTGATGSTGPSGATGAKGESGATGAKGDDGSQGPPFSGVANFTGVNIQGPTMCAVPIDQSCLGPGGCFNFTLCTIVMEGGYVQGVTQAPIFVVGGLGSAFGATFQLGQTGSDGHSAYFGKRFGANPTAYKIAIFQTYATAVVLEASNFFTIRSVFNLDVISETGTITLRSQGGAIDVSATTDITFAQSGLANTISFNAAGSFVSTASYIALQTDTILFQSGSGSNQWYRTNPSRSLTCSAVSFPPAVDLTRKSQSLYTDVIMEPYPSNQILSSGRIISNSSDGFVNVGPYLKVCSGTVRSGGTTLTLQGNVLTDVVSINALYITNNAAGGFPVTFFDPEGVDFKNTYLLNSNATVNPLDCGVTGALIINDDLVVTQTITHNGIAACASDARAKKNVQPIDIAKAHERITSLKIKSFEYTPEFISGGGHGGVRLNTTYYGVLAQDVKNEFGYLVNIVSRKLSGIRVPDFHLLQPELLYGELVGAIQHMDQLHRSLASKIEEIERKLLK